MSMIISVTADVSTEVEVDIDLAEVIDAATDEELKACGVIRLFGATTQWHELRDALRSGTTTRINDLLADMAWHQGGVILPIGTPLIH